MNQSRQTPDQLFNEWVEKQRTTSYKTLLKEHSLDEVGYWQVVGETRDAYTSGPVIGIYHGKLEHVIRYAVVQPAFVTYGSGGDINYVKVTEVSANSVNDFQKLQEERNRLEADLARIQARLKDIS